MEFDSSMSCDCSCIRDMNFDEHSFLQVANDMGTMVPSLHPLSKKNLVDLKYLSIILMNKTFKDNLDKGSFNH